MEQIIEKIKQEARDGWKGPVGEDRAERLDKFLRKMVASYAEKLGLSETDVMDALEKRRDFSAINYYQESRFPPVDAVNFFDTIEDFKAATPAHKYRCPACKGESSSPYVCSCEGCDWKSYGLLGCLGEGYPLAIKKNFLVNPKVEVIFMPLDFEAQNVETV